MRKEWTVTAAAGFVLLGGCDAAPLANVANETNAARAEVANVTSSPTPGNDIAEGKPAAAEPITAEWFAGRWSTDSDCSSIATFSADGRFVNTVGERGTWSVADNQLTLTMDGQSATIPMVRIDARTVDGIGERGNTRQYRC